MSYYLHMTQLRQMGSVAAGSSVVESAKTWVSPAVWVRVEAPVRDRLLPLAVYVLVSGFLVWKWGVLSLIGWIVGVKLGWWFLDLDHLLDVLWVHPETPVAIQFRELISKKEWRKAFILLFDTRTQRKELVLHSIVFQGMVFLLGLYVATSNSAFLGKGLLLGLWGRMIYEQVKLYWKDGDLSVWLWQIRDGIPHTFQGLLIVCEVLVWFWLTLMAV